MAAGPGCGARVLSQAVQPAGPYGTGGVSAGERYRGESGASSRGRMAMQPQALSQATWKIINLMKSSPWHAMSSGVDRAPDRDHGTPSENVLVLAGCYIEIP